MLVVFVIPLIVLPLIAYGRTVRKLSRRAQDTLAESSAFAAENISEVRTLQSFTNEGAILSRYRATIEETFQAARSRMTALAPYQRIPVTLANTRKMMLPVRNARAVMRERAA